MAARVSDMSLGAVCKELCEDAGIANVSRPDGVPVDWKAVYEGHQESVATLARATDAVMEGLSVFITGQAGTGKTVCLTNFVQRLLAKDKEVHVTAFTGMAALLVGGTTLHKWIGAGLAEGTVEELVTELSGRARLRWTSTDVLVIDEVSMVSPDLFEKIEQVARILRGCPTKFFGGIQLVCFGDFAQLPAIVNDRERKFVFQSRVWEQGISKVFVLKHIYRQTDELYGGILQRVRVEEHTDEDILILKMRLHKTLSAQKDHNVKATRLYAHNDDVDTINAKELAELPGEADVFKAVAWPVGLPSAHLIKFSRAEKMARKYCTAKEELELKVDAQVMLIVNLDQGRGLVNGSRGRVISITHKDGDDDDEDEVKVLFANGITTKIKHHDWTFENVLDDGNGIQFTLMYRQVPLKLCWAATIHKAQGSSLDCAEIDLGERVFVEGQAYVALSRVRSLDGLSLVSLEPSVFKANRLFLSYWRYLIKHGNHRGWLSGVNKIRFPTEQAIGDMVQGYVQPSRMDAQGREKRPLPVWQDTDEQQDVDDLLRSDPNAFVDEMRGVSDAPPAKRAANGEPS